jgi:hypothetical protein
MSFSGARQTARFEEEREDRTTPHTRISCTRRQTTAACTAFVKESRMTFINADRLNRNPENRLIAVELPTWSLPVGEYSGSGAGCYCRRNGRSPLLETGSTKHGATLRGLKGNGGFRSALRTDCPRFCAHPIAGSCHALDFALFATLWIVFELLIVKEQLFAGGKDKVVTTIRTFQYLIDEIHYASPRACLGIFSIPSTDR